MHARTVVETNVRRMRNVEARRTDITRLIENLSTRSTCEHVMELGSCIFERSPRA